MGRLKDKVAVITGGASGIGEATVKLFIDEGAKVAFSDQDNQRGMALSKDITSRGNDVLFVNAKMELEDQALSFVKRGADYFGQIDILVNNVAIRMFQTVVEASEESWDRILSVNVKSYAFCAKAAIPLMIKSGGGSIINVASVASSIKGLPNRFAYGASKAAIIGLTKSIASDFVKQKIRCNAIAPGTVFTPSWEDRVKQSPDPVKAKKDFIARQPMGRLGTAQEIADFAIYLASDESTFTTGNTFSVDGGMTI